MSERHQKKDILTLFLSFLKIGAFTFGGGYAMLALLENEFVSVKKWLTREEFLDMTAIAESTPGPVAINSATFIGHKIAGVAGSAAATLGVVLPSFVIIFVISLFFDTFMSFTYVQYAFRGIRVCVVYLIFNAGLKLLRSLKPQPLNIVIISAVCAVMILCSIFAVSFSSILAIALSGLVGLAVWGVRQLRGKERSE